MMESDRDRDDRYWRDECGIHTYVVLPPAAHYHRYEVDWRHPDGPRLVCVRGRHPGEAPCDAPVVPLTR